MAKMAKTVKKVKENISTTNKRDVTTSFQDRDTKIAELAYYKAENRGFEAGYEHGDWFAAEQELDLVMPTDSETSSLTIAAISSDVVPANNAGGGYNSVALADLTTADKVTRDKVSSVKAVKNKTAASKPIAVKAAKDKTVQLL